MHPSWRVILVRYAQISPQELLPSAVSAVQMNAFTRKLAYSAFERPILTTVCRCGDPNTNTTVTNEMNRTLSRSQLISFGFRYPTFTRSLFSSFSICNFQTEILIHNALALHSEIYSPTSQRVCNIN